MMQKCIIPCVKDRGALREMVLRRCNTHGEWRIPIVPYLLAVVVSGVVPGVVDKCATDWPDLVANQVV